MNENINIAEILKNAPKGTKLWSPIFGECEFQGISYAYKPATIYVHTIKEYVLGNDTHEFADFLDDGRLATCCSEDGECLLFPSKENRDWLTFKAPWKHKHFEPFQKVLVPCYFGDVHKHMWCADWYSHFDEKVNNHCTIGNGGFPDDEILPYEGNEYKLGKPITTK